MVASRPSNLPLVVVTLPQCTRWGRFIYVKLLFHGIIEFGVAIAFATFPQYAHTSQAIGLFYKRTRKQTCS
jgi:hypothetical protein